MIVETDYCPSHRHSLLKLVGREGFPDDLWIWQFESNPRQRPFNPVLLCDQTTEEPVAFNSVMPVRAIFRGIEQDACWSCDFHVAAIHRGTGLGRRVKELLHCRSSLLMTFGVSPMAAPVLKRMGWQPSTAVSQYRKVFTGQRLTDRVRQLLQTAERIKAKFRIHRRRTVLPHLKVTFSWALPEVELCDELWRRVASSYRNIVVRDHAYLEWRYMQCPVARYRFILVWENKVLRAIGIIRHERRITRLVDLVVHANDAQSKQEIVAAWLAREELADSALATTSDYLLGEELLAAGFIRAGKRPGFFVRSADGDPTVADDWFIMAGDSDGEFLQAAQNTIQGDRI